LEAPIAQGAIRFDLGGTKKAALHAALAVFETSHK
jgi:hypothetical protein